MGGRVHADAELRTSEIHLPCGCGRKARLSFPRKVGCYRFVRQCPQCAGEWTFLVEVDPTSAVSLTFGTFFAEGVRDPDEGQSAAGGWIDNGNPFTRESYRSLWQTRIQRSASDARAANKLGVHQLVCDGCGNTSDAFALGWRMPNAETVVCPSC